MIKIHPELDFHAKCPLDHAPLIIDQITIPNLHCLGNALCPICSNQYYVDLAVGQAIWSPVTLNRSTADIFVQDGFEWFSQPLQQGFLAPEQSQVTPIIHKFFHRDRIIIVNCLDYLYGHSLLKLLNVQRHLDESPELGCCVLVPTQLKHLVPEGVAEIWEFPIPIKDGKKWYPTLATWIDAQCQVRKECFLSEVYSHPSHKFYDLNRFVKNLPDISSAIAHHSPIILFSYRADRTWGKTPRHQQRNIQKLYEQLSLIFPDMLFVLVGFGKQDCIKPIAARHLDLRTDKFDRELDQKWMAYMSAADCTVGVHGSNMLLPSGLAKSTVELVYSSRIGNIVQDFLFDKYLQDPRDALLFYRMLYGNNTLSDISPSTVTNSVANILAHGSVNSAWFKVGENDHSGFDFDTDKKNSQEARIYLNKPVSRSYFNRIVRKIALSVLTITD